jgi:hypothetical protein
MSDWIVQWLGSEKQVLDEYQLSRETIEEVLYAVANRIRQTSIRVPLNCYGFFAIDKSIWQKDLMERLS